MGNNENMIRKPYTIVCGDRRIELGVRTRIMGVVNVTPDSFSDGGRFLDAETAVSQGEKLVREGADIIDIGGESTRPFSDPVPIGEEIRRVIPVIEALSKRISAPISIDTAKAAVARRAIEAGAGIINDISALRSDPDMGHVAAESGVPVILMHMKGNPENMQVSPDYDDLMGEIGSFLKDAIRRAEALGIDPSKIVIDPGIGFGKTVEHNLVILKQLSDLNPLDAPILSGPSRKSFLRKLIKPEDVEDIDPDLPKVEAATQAAVAASVLNGAHIVRVHDVAGTRTCLTILDAVMNASSSR